MAYKARIVTCSSHAQLMKHVKEVMLAAGWINKTPSGQDDPNGYALGFFMNSPGESGNEDIKLHCAVASGYCVPGIEHRYRAGHHHARLA